MRNLFVITWSILFLCLITFIAYEVNALSYSSSVEEDVSIFERYDYYSIYGNTVDDLQKQMTQKGPRRYWAMVRWYVEWTDACDVTLKIDINLPRWRDKTSAPLQVQDKWEVMYANLIKHEMQHREHGRLAAFNVKKFNCDGAYSFIRHWAREDRNFDARTQNGKLEGVHFDD